MPSLKDTKRRIVSVKSTQKITRAMKLVSSAKYARASHALSSSQDFGIAIDSMVAQVLNAEDYSDTLWTSAPKSKSILLILALR